jgi:chloramphenicol 3-O phosphotransferase
MPGTIVILNGVPRSGKSSIARVIQDTFDGIWMNVGADVFINDITPPRYRPSVGLRPGEEQHPLFPLMPAFFSALYGSIAAHSRAGLNVVADVTHHDAPILRDCARVLDGLPVLFVGVHCSLETIMTRRNAGHPGRDGVYVVATPEDPVPEPVRRWQAALARVGPYDMELDTSLLTPEQCAQAIRERIGDGLTSAAFARLARET